MAMGRDIEVHLPFIICWGENMEARTLARFKKVLLEEKTRIAGCSRASIQNNDLNVSPEDLPDEADLAANEISKTLIFKLRERERQMLRKLEEALDRIDEGSFGVCMGCEENIEPRRLEARPMSTLCLSCKELEEHREKIYA
jgi:DnaK suppressor protein